MIAPLEFSRNAKTVSGETAAAMTHRKPTTDEARIATAGTPRLGHADQLQRCLTAGREDEQHPRRGVHARVEAAQHRGQHDGVHDVVGVGNPHLGERGDERRRGDGLVVPRQDHRQQEDRADVEEWRCARSPSWRPWPPLAPGSFDSAAAMVATSAPVIEKITVTTAAVIPIEPVGQEAAVGGQVGEVHGLVRPQTEHVGRAHGQEHDDRGDLDTGEPELELTERRDREQVGQRSSRSTGPASTTTAGCRVSSTGRSWLRRWPRIRR